MNGAMLSLDKVRTGSALDRGAAAALALLYGTAFFSHFSVALGQICLLGLFVCCMLYIARLGTQAWSDPFVWLCAVFVVYVALRTGLAVLQRPDMAVDHIDGGRRLLRSGFLPALAVAYALIRSPRPAYHAIGVMIAVVAGILVSGALNFDPSNPASVVDSRATFGLGMISHAALVLATLFLMSVTIAARLLCQEPLSRARLLAGGLFMLLGLAALIGVIFNKTRSLWLGLALGMLCGVIYLVWLGVREHRNGLRAAATIMAVIAVASAALVHEPIQKRWEKAAPDIEEALTLLQGGDIDQLDAGPIGDRVHWAVFGARLLADRPILGYGPAESRYLRTERDDVPSNIADKPTHFHNGLMDLALRVGAIGVIVFAAGAAWLFRGASRWKNCADGPGGPFIAAFIITWVITLGVHQAGNHRFLDFNVAYIVAIVAGMAHAGWLVSRERQNRGRV